MARWLERSRFGRAFGVKTAAGESELHGHEPCIGGDVVSPLVVLAEPDPALRRLMSTVLCEVPCDVLECSSPLQLRVELTLRSSAGSLLLILNAGMAKECARDVVMVARQRKNARLSALGVLFICEMGQLGQPHPEIGPAELLGTFEKPFDIADLEALARDYGGPRDAAREL